MPRTATMEISVREIIALLLLDVITLTEAIVAMMEANVLPMCAIPPLVV
jgi:hypothetical protein